MLARKRSKWQFERRGSESQIRYFEGILDDPTVENDACLLTITSKCFENMFCFKKKQEAFVMVIQKMIFDGLQVKK